MASFRHALLQGYPDRVAKRREPGSPRVLLASGHGAVIAEESGVRGGEYLVALDVQAGRRGEPRRARTARQDRSADPDGEHRRTGVAVTDRDPRRARARSGVGDRRAHTRATTTAASCCRNGTRRPTPTKRRGCSLPRTSRAGLTAADEQLLRRLRFAGLEPDVAGLVADAARQSRSLARHRSRARARLERRGTSSTAPRRRRSPSRADDPHPLDYQADGSVVRHGEAAGALRPWRHAAHRRTRGAGAPRPDRAQRPAGADDARSSQLLGTHVPGGAQGAARPVPEAPLAGRSVDGRPDRANEAADVAQG